ncbi:MAG: MFS transporter [Acidipila sp.]|nr:MFS transporter [Acidipila sp.]
MSELPSKLVPVDTVTAAAVKKKRLPVVFRALKHRNFQLFFAGQMISLIGTWMQTVAQSWLVYRITGSAVLLGTVGFASQFPVFVLSTVGGIVADGNSKHRIVIATQASSMCLAFVLAALTLSGRIQVWHIIVLASLLGTVNAFDIPARQAFLVEMVGKEDLLNAIGLNSSMFNGARVVGPAVAGILVASIGEGWCFFANAVSYLAVIAGLLAMKLKKRAAPRRSGSAVADVLEGFRYARNTLPIFAILLLLGLVSVVGLPYAVLMPIFADKILHSGPRGYSLLMSAAGLGAMMGALTLATRQGVRGLGRLVALAASGFGISLILFSLSRSFWLSIVLLVPAGFCVMLLTACCNTLIQTMVPDHLRGRMMGLYSMMFMGMAPLGALGAGLAANWFGAPITVALGGVVCLLGAAGFARVLPQIRAEARQLIVAQGLIPGEPAETLPVRSVS